MVPCSVHVAAVRDKHGIVYRFDLPIRCQEEKDALRSVTGDPCLDLFGSIGE